MTAKLQIVKKTNHAELRRRHMELVWPVVKLALKWNSTKKGALGTAIAAVELRKACDALDEFEKELD